MIMHAQVAGHVAEQVPRLLLAAQLFVVSRTDSRIEGGLRATTSLELAWWRLQANSSTARPQMFVLELG